MIDVPAKVLGIRQVAIVRLAVLGALSVVAAVALAQQAPAAVPLKRDKFEAVMSALLAKDTGDVTVLPPDKIDQNGQFHGDGLTGRLPSTLPTKLVLGGSADPVKSAAASPHGAYCSGFVLQVLAHAYSQTSLDSGNPAPSPPSDPAGPTVPMPFGNASNATQFADRWYLASRNATDPNANDYRGVVWAAAGAPDDLFEVRSFASQSGPAASGPDLCAAAKTCTDRAKVDQLMTGLRKFDFLQVWLPSTIAADAQMAHTAVYVGYGLHAPAATGASGRKAHVRVYYWSTQYENVAARNVPATAADKTTVAFGKDEVEKAVVESGRRVGYSYVDVPTEVAVPADDKTFPDQLKVRPAAAAFAMSLKFQ